MKRIYMEWKTLYQQFDRILLLFAVAFATVEVVWVPLNSWLSEILLEMTGYAYLSPTNVLAVLAAKWWVTVLFLLLVLSNLVLVYLEIGLLTVGLMRILQQEEGLFSYFSHLLAELKRIFKQMSVAKIVYVLLYSAVFFPFLRKVVGIYYVNKLVVPQFILDYLAKNQLVALGMTVALLVFFWLAARLIYSLPLIYKDGVSVQQAIASSFQKTREKGVWKSYFKLLGLVTRTIVAFVVVGAGIYFIQIAADRWTEGIAFYLALFHVVLLYLFYYGILSLFLLKFISYSTESELPMPHQQQLHHGMRLGILLLASLYFGLQAFVFLYYPFEDLPVTISHRGVDMENGVQNTIDSLEKTAQLKPDYIEMDVQETKDGLFVVMHDTDLKALTGHEGGTHDYTLAELTQMMASENGQSSPVPSFDEYLQVSENLQQKLLVEIKTSKADSPQLMQHFLQTYGKRLVAGGHQMQSLDYDVVEAVKKFDDKLLAAFILPFNSIYPTTVADGYTMEYSSLDQSFVLKSWIRKKLVYAWTPNSEDSMMRMLQLQVDGIITDNLQELQATIQDFTDHQSYADMIFLQLHLLFLQF